MHGIRLSLVAALVLTLGCGGDDRRQAMAQRDIEVLTSGDTEAIRAYLRGLERDLAALHAKPPQIIDREIDADDLRASYRWLTDLRTVVEHLSMAAMLDTRIVEHDRSRQIMVFRASWTPELEADLRRRLLALSEIVDTIEWNAGHTVPRLQLETIAIGALIRDLLEPGATAAEAHRAPVRIGGTIEEALAALSPLGNGRPILAMETADPASGLKMWSLQHGVLIATYSKAGGMITHLDLWIGDASRPKGLRVAVTVPVHSYTPATGAMHLIMPADGEATEASDW